MVTVHIMTVLLLWLLYGHGFRRTSRTQTPQAQVRGRPAVTKVLLGSLKGRGRGRRRFRVAIRAGVWALVPTDVSEPKWQFVSGFESDVATYAGISRTKAGSCAVYLAVYYTQRPQDSMAAIPESAVRDKLAVTNSQVK